MSGNSAYRGRSLVAIALFGAGLLLLAGCGTTSSSAGVASLGRTSSSVPAGGTATTLPGTDPSSPQFQAAGKACRRYFPAPHLSQAQIAQHEESLLKFARCMRKNGAPNYPDPKFAANGAVTEGGLDPNLPNLQAAANACGG